MLGLITPCSYLNGICEIDIEALERQGIEALLFDVDNTITTWNCPNIDENVVAWFDALKRSSIKGCIISNNSPERLQGVADELGLSYEANAKKPLPFGYKRAMRKLQCDKKHTLMVGDQLFTDVLGANLAGIKAVLLKPISTLHEFRGTRINRKMEKIVMGSVLKRVAKKSANQR